MLKKMEEKRDAVQSSTVGQGFIAGDNVSGKNDEESQSVLFVSPKNDGLLLPTSLESASPSKDALTSVIVCSPVSSHDESDRDASLRFDPGELVDSDVSYVCYQIAYLSVFAIFGSVVRSYMARFWGLDCEYGEINDSVAPLFQRICVTNTGKTLQTGGALFTDLPSNMLGSFLVGALSPVAGSGHTLPWFHENHHLQNNQAFHDALKIGFCGCLTTFASWNTQMVYMLDGTDTVLGPQVAAALFGYLIGFLCAAASFMVGRHVSDCWRTIHRRSVDKEEENNEEQLRMTAVENTDTLTRKASCSARGNSVKIFGLAFGPFILTAFLLAGIIVADFVYGILWYRQLWLTCIFTPFGACLRWKLAVLNSWNGYWKRLSWVPWGTFIANMCAVVVSIMAEATFARYGDPGQNGYRWLSTALPAIEAGFAGSLSTVSTVMKELFSMQKPSHSYIYISGSLVCAMFLGLVVYCPIVRS